MINQNMPDFMFLVNTSRQSRASQKQYASYQCLAAIIRRLDTGDKLIYVIKKQQLGVSYVQ